ncbi:MAG TPA: radical SAM protein [Bacteroidales bacterium]|nr:radical SAM protein [Bacteroidales bacterium]
MAGFLFHETVFGPVMSRRLGVSLGINLLPVDYKYCTFNCVYCECGWTNKKPKNSDGLPTRDQVLDLLKGKLKALKREGKAPDAITFAGNGEPTIHPEFAGIIDDTITLRDEFFPEARITVLSNASMLERDHVFNALLKVEDNIQKLDAGTEKMFRLINQPGGNLTLEKVVDLLCQFNGRLIIQTLFLRGEHNGEKVDNTSNAEIEAWLGKLKKINPQYVMIYPIDRATPEQNIEKVSFDELNRIAGKVQEIGLKTKVFG